jgi:hypothetical protein
MLSHVTSYLTLLPSISEWRSDTASLKHTHTFIPHKEINQTQLFCRNLLFCKAQRGITVELCSTFTTQSTPATYFNPFLPQQPTHARIGSFLSPNLDNLIPSRTINPHWMDWKICSVGYASMLHAVQYSVGYKFVVLLKQVENTAAFKIKLC